MMLVPGHWGHATELLLAHQSSNVMVQGAQGAPAAASGATAGGEDEDENARKVETEMRITTSTFLVDRLYARFVHPATTRPPIRS